MNASLTYRSTALNIFAREVAESAYGVLRRAEPSEAERVLLSRAAKIDETLAVCANVLAHRDVVKVEVVEAVEAIRPSIKAQAYEAVYSVALVALTTRGYRPEAVAPVDYPALAEALRHEA